MRLAEQAQIVSAIVPVDLQSAQVGDFVSMKNYNHCSIVIFSSAGTDGDDLVITLNQQTDVSNSASDNKALNIKELYYKIGDTDLLSTGTFTRVTQTPADGYDFDSLDQSQNDTIIIIEIDRDELDTDNDFDCLSISIADTGSNALLGCVLYILTEPRYAGAEAIED